MRRGWVQTTRHTEPSPRLMWSSRMNWVTWVVFPHPVSPLTTTTRFELISSVNSFKWRDKRRSKEDTSRERRRKRVKEVKEEASPLFSHRMAGFFGIAKDNTIKLKQYIFIKMLWLYLISLQSNYELTSISLYFGLDFFSCRSLFNRSSNELFLHTSWNKKSKSLSFFLRISLSSFSSCPSGSCSSSSHASGGSSLTFFVEKHLKKGQKKKTLQSMLFCDHGTTTLNSEVLSDSPNLRLGFFWLRLMSSSSKLMSAVSSSGASPSK